MSTYVRYLGPPGVLGIWGKWLFNFREQLGSTGNYFQGFGEQAHSFGDLGSPAKSNLKGNSFILFDFLKKNLQLLKGGEPRGYLNVFTFVLTC